MHSLLHNSTVTAFVQGLPNSILDFYTTFKLLSRPPVCTQAFQATLYTWDRVIFKKHRFDQDITATPHSQILASSHTYSVFRDILLT